MPSTSGWTRWSFDYKGRIFTIPVLSLCFVEAAIAELDWAVERGARAILVRPAPVPGYRGPRSFAHAVASWVCHGALFRHPGLNVAVIENGSAWLAPLLNQLADVYKKTPESFPRRPDGGESAAASTSARSGLWKTRTS